MHSLGIEREFVASLNKVDPQAPVEMWVELAVSRGLPVKGIAAVVGANANQAETSLTRTMTCCALFDLTRGGKVKKTVGTVFG